MDGLIDKESNPFIKDSWIDQGYSFTPDRQELTPILFKRSIEEIKSLKEENYCSYPAFLAIRWGFAFLRNNILFPSYKWNHRENYDRFGKLQRGFNISDERAKWENEFNVKIFETYDLAKNIGILLVGFCKRLERMVVLSLQNIGSIQKRKNNRPAKVSRL